MASKDREQSGRLSVRARNVLGLGVLGLISGTLVWAVLWAIVKIWEPSHLFVTKFHLAGWKMGLDHYTLVPGILFGIIIGVFLWTRDLIRPWHILAYVIAATVSNSVATNFAYDMIDEDSAAVIGMEAGLIGAGCLTAISLLLFPFLRRPVPFVLMLAAGTLLGSLLHVTMEYDFGWGFGVLVLYAAWQAGYAAALGTAVPPRQRA